MSEEKLGLNRDELNFNTKFKNKLVFQYNMTTYSYELKIPKDRVAVLIGKKGEIKKKIEKATKTKLHIDSKEGDVLVEGDDGVKLLIVKGIVTAIGRGFNPEIAMLLLKHDYALEVIDIGETKKEHLKRIKGRLIGSEGKARRAIEELTDCNISVFGKTVSIIGPIEYVVTVRRAVEMLIKGSPHSNVYKMLERKRSESKWQMQ